MQSLLNPDFLLGLLFHTEDGGNIDLRNTDGNTRDRDWSTPVTGRAGDGEVQTARRQNPLTLALRPATLCSGSIGGQWLSGSGCYKPEGRGFDS
jgi:hypothetical protein